MRNFSQSVRPVLGSAALLLASVANAGPLSIANPSFESPSTPFVSTQVDGWQKTPQPIWFDPATSGGYTWNDMSGVFANTAVGQPNHIPNMTGSQGLFVLAVPTAGLFQILPDTFEVGMRYDLTVGLIGGGGNMPEGSQFMIGLFYLDGANPVGVAANVVSHSAATFPTTTEFRDFSVTIPLVGAGDPNAGKNIGIHIVNANATGVGYWDVDNVRLVATVVPEAETWALLGLGTLLTAAAVRSSRRD